MSIADKVGGLSSITKSSFCSPTYIDRAMNRGTDGPRHHMQLSNVSIVSLLHLELLAYLNLVDLLN